MNLWKISRIFTPSQNALHLAVQVFILILFNYINDLSLNFCFEAEDEVQTETNPGPVAHHEPIAAPVPSEAHWGPKKYYFWNHPLQLMVHVYVAL